MKFNPLIALHSKSELRGWNEVLRERADWPGWNAADKSMIEHLMQTGDFVATIGWTMYQIVIEKR
jgi:hypothetical protein